MSQDESNISEAERSNSAFGGSRTEFSFRDLLTDSYGDESDKCRFRRPLPFEDTSDDEPSTNPDIQLLIASKGEAIGRFAVSIGGVINSVVDSRDETVEKEADRETVFNAGV